MEGKQVQRKGSEKRVCPSFGPRVLRKREHGLGRVSEGKAALREDGWTSAGPGNPEVRGGEVPQRITLSSRGGGSTGADSSLW